MRHAGSVRAQRCRGVEVALRGGRRREPKRRRRIQDHRSSMRRQWVVRRVAFLAECPHHSRHGVRHAVRQMNARVAEADACVGSRQQHHAPGFVVGGIRHRPRQILAHHAQRLQRPNIADRIRPLVSGAQERPLRRGPVGVGYRRVRLDRMRENVESRRGGDGRRQRARVVGIEQAQRRFQVAVRDAGLGMHGDKVEDGDAGRFAAGSRRCRRREQRLQGARNRTALADRRIDVLQEIGGIRRIQIGGLGGVDRRSAADCDESFRLDCDRFPDGFLKRSIRRLHGDLAVKRNLDAGVVERCADHCDRRQFRQEAVGQQHDLADAAVGKVESQLARHARAESNVGRGQLHCVFVCHDSACVKTARQPSRSKRCRNNSRSPSTATGISMP